MSESKVILFIIIVLPSRLRYVWGRERKGDCLIGLGVAGEGGGEGERRGKGKKVKAC